jgi:hypothetical protein
MLPSLTHFCPVTTIISHTSWHGHCVIWLFMGMNYAIAEGKEEILTISTFCQKAATAMINLMLRNSIF